MGFIIYTLMTIFLSATAWAEIVPAKGAILRRIDWSNEIAKKRYGNNFNDLIGKPYDNLAIKIKVDAITKELFNSGYFNADLKTELAGTETNIIVKADLVTHGRLNLSFNGNKVFSHQELRTKILDKIRNDFGKIDREELASYLTDVYEIGGYYNTRVTSYQNEGTDQEKLLIKNFFFVIEEGKKVRVKDISFRGNTSVKSGELMNLFKKNASTLAEGGFYDKVFFDEFTNILKKEYLSRGFVYADVSKPRVITNEEEGVLQIEYGISEKQQIILKTVLFKNVPEDMQAGVKAAIANKEGAPLNVVELESDLRKSIIHFQSLGYYFASIANMNGEGLLVYNLTDSTAELSPQIILDRKICFHEAKINGNIKTKSEVIDREINLAQGDLITPDKLEVIRQKLSGTGLFSTLRITPYMMYEAEEVSCPKTNLVIQVKEKDFGQVEVAGGYRTDLGAKLSTGISYNNIGGMNQSASLRLQANQRFNLDGFDERRRVDDKKRLEYLAKATFVDPYIFHGIINTQLEFELSSSLQRTRFYGFDADIFRISPQISKTFNKHFTSSISYQFERISTFDATEDKDNDNFSIGGITPTVSFDFRDDPINPKKGAFFTLSSEWANNRFGSMKQADLEVNFIKVISRNKFYYPMGDFVLAVSLAGGYQKNFAQDIIGTYDNGQVRTQGYIPSIKVFRLDGYDEIRGYDEGEINRLKNGQPIGEVVVQNEAYFTAFKFEPRYNINDFLQLGVFFDAGRIFVNEFDPLDLRTSVGAGLKFLTQVGSLDFDYGFKLKRKNYPDLARDSVGRFHLSIGFF